MAASNEEREEFNNALKVLTEQLRESSSIQDAFYSINLERQCIAVEQILRPDKLGELNQQLLKSSAAEQGLRFVVDAGAYKAQIEKVFINGITELPSGEPYETFVSAQKRHLEASKKNFRTPEEVDFFNARMSNLSAGVRNFKELQEGAVFPDRAAAKAEARKLVGEDGQVYRPNPKGEYSYKGEILAVTETHAIQRTSKNAVYIHELKDFPDGKAPSAGDTLTIRYSQARIETIEPAKSQSPTEKQKDLGR
ncbi:MAG: hypothetical protein GX256_07715 [Fretibacterium sp.]|nr:hypothetical protein [Fretibacterium sp.]